MKKNLLLPIFLMIAGLSTANAQLFEKLDKAIRQVDKAAATTENASKTGSSLLSMFGKKKKNADGNQTVIAITNGNLAIVKKANTMIDSLKGVSDSQMHFDAEQSLILVEHEDTTEDLLALIQKKDSVLFKDENIVAIKPGEITVTLQK